MAVPPEIDNAKSPTSNAPDPPLVSYTASLNVTAIVELLPAIVVPVIVGNVPSYVQLNVFETVFVFSAASEYAPA